MDLFEFWGKNDTRIEPRCSVIKGLSNVLSAFPLDMFAWHYKNMPIQIYRKFHLQKLKFR